MTQQPSQSSAGQEVAARTFIGGPEQAAQFVAAVSWPNERVENRDSWAPRLLAEPEMLAIEAASARARLESAIAVCARVAACQHSWMQWPNRRTACRHCRVSMDGSPS